MDFLLCPKASDKVGMKHASEGCIFVQGRQVKKNK